MYLGEGMYGWAASITISSVHYFRCCCSPHAQSIHRTSNAHISHTHTPANTSGNQLLVRTSDASTWPVPFILAGAGDGSFHYGYVPQ